MNAGWSVEQMAVAAGLAIQTAYNAENGLRRPAMSTCERLVDALNKRMRERAKKNGTKRPTAIDVVDLWPSPLVAAR